MRFDEARLDRKPGFVFEQDMTGSVADDIPDSRRKTLMQAIVVTFDRLCSRLIGCYGNEWIETPNLDRLAATATVFDSHFTDSVGQRSGHAWLTGRQATQANTAEPFPRLCDLLRDAGVSSHLIAAEQMSSIPWDSAGFGEVQRVSGHNGLDVVPTDVPIAKAIQAAAPLFSKSASETAKRLIWLHAPEPGIPPEGFASLYFEDFEERGFPLADIPRDEWSRLIAVAAGSMSLVDHWLGELLSRIKSHSHDRPTLVLIAAARGRSWTEDFFATAPSTLTDSPATHLRSQETGCPLIVMVQGDDRHAELSGLRCTRFVQPLDIPPTLMDWFGISTETANLKGRSLLGEAVSERPARTEIYFGDDKQNIGVRTADWNCLVRLTRSENTIPKSVCFGDAEWPEQVQLFAKPEDIWDVTDQSTQQPEVCEGLVRKLSPNERALS